MSHLEAYRGTQVWHVGFASVLILGVPGIAEAAFIPPVGVSEYRLLFTTSGTRDATSSTIADYNAFVTAQAALAGDLPSTVWTAVASTASVDAVDNIACGVSCNALPIYLTNGTLLAANSAAFFNAATVSLPASPSVDQFGNTNYNYVWTGSNPDGTGNDGRELGTSSPRLGDSSYDDFWMLNFASADASGVVSLYAISGAIEAPEPASGLALLAGGLLVTRVFRRRR